MQSLSRKPNLLFLTFVRRCWNLTNVKSLTSKIHKNNLIKALTVVSIDKYGAKQWTVNGMLHRKNGPAEIIYENGKHIVYRWYKFGKYHRKNGPASIYRDGSQYWHKNGKYHRDDGPAYIEYNNGVIVEQLWYKYGKPYKDFFTHFSI